MNGSDLEFKIGIVGPTRVGKTSLIASILQDSQRLLAGTPVSIGARGTGTEKRVAKSQKELEGSLRAGEFNPGAVRGTEEPFTYRLRIDPGTAGAAVHLSILDYPGGWLDSDRRPSSREKDWERCKLWITQSTVLIVPVESTVLMEASAGSYRRSIPSILTTYEVNQVAREWAKHRARRPHEPALLMFCPIKCETYFADNGGTRDRSMDLFDAVRDLYDETIRTVRAEADHLRIIYAPVDTIGSAELKRARWREASESPGGYEFSADYLVRPPARQKIKGADSVLVALCRHLIAAKRRVESDIAEDKESAAYHARARAERDEGFLLNFWVFLSGERERRRREARRRRAEARGHRIVVENLEQTLERLATREDGPRVKHL